MYGVKDISPDDGDGDQIEDLNTKEKLGNLLNRVLQGMHTDPAMEQLSLGKNPGTIISGIEIQDITVSHRWGAVTDLFFTIKVTYAEIVKMLEGSSLPAESNNGVIKAYSRIQVRDRSIESGHTWLEKRPASETGLHPDHRLRLLFTVNSFLESITAAELPSLPTGSVGVLLGLPAVGKTTMERSIPTALTLGDEPQHNPNVLPIEDYSLGRELDEYVGLAMEGSGYTSLPVRITVELVKHLESLISYPKANLPEVQNTSVDMRVDLLSLGSNASQLTGYPLLLNGSVYQKLISRLAYLRVNPFSLVEPSRIAKPEAIWHLLQNPIASSYVLDVLSNSEFNDLMMNLDQHLGYPEMLFMEVDREIHRKIIQSQSIGDKNRRASALARVEWLRVWYFILKQYLIRHADTRGARPTTFKFYETRDLNSPLPFEALDVKSPESLECWKAKVNADPRIMHIILRLRIEEIRQLFIGLHSQGDIFPIIKSYIVFAAERIRYLTDLSITIPDNPSLLPEAKRSIMSLSYKLSRQSAPSNIYGYAHPNAASEIFLSLQKLISVYEIVATQEI